MSTPDPCPPDETLEEDEFDRYEDRAEQWQRDFCELSAPTEQI